ncbi:dolichyl-diphosphooligosaccharide--protein glycosyltransferase 48 kDa subunit-like [Paramacrobiotus metropolitanus]|uniref:dolichyl-diphosphooligosaccharide--protein glycosyltransferase 48 kDa subunit-like n=1 Tax=Paramacrobiotus metropolitanus TaxID=2943436 RepID=UPI0024457ED3|nr:dolichyl-diphosphooligosaccharide--protein glycosyltransferase 48 kDa subunit-like [Paramacrobiotus metropolitanus]
MMNFLNFLTILLFASTTRTELIAKGDKKVLVLLDNANIKETHSKFFKSLTDKGFELDFKQADAASLTLFKYGERLYNHIIIFAPSVDEFGGQVKVEALANFVDDGGNLLVAAGDNLGEAIRDLTAEFGFELDEDTSRVVDHFHYDAKLDDGWHSTVIADSAALLKAPTIVGKPANAPLLFRGVALLPDKENPLVLEILRAPSTAYSHHPTRPISLFPSGIGRNIALIGALQARNNARVVVSGSLEFFSNQFFDATVNPAEGENQGSSSQSGKAGNADLAIALANWVFKESGVLKVGAVRHYREGEFSEPADYTIKDNVVYTIEITEKQGDKWVPYHGEDVQLEFVRIDPFVRTKLTRKDGKFVAHFVVPDVYGVYQFKVDYDRLGYTHLFSTTQVSVRPYKHTEYERFIGSAFPYYISALSMIAGTFLFVIVFNSFKDDEPASVPAKLKKEQ